jgi:hypothetical protein
VTAVRGVLCQWALLAGACLVCLPQRASAQATRDVVAIHEQVSRFDLGRVMATYEDRDGVVALDELLAGKRSFSPPVGKRSPNFGMTRSTFWFQAELLNKTRARQSLLVEVPYAMLDEVDFFAVDARSQIVRRFTTGSLRPFRDRLVPHRHFLFPVELAPQESQRVLLRVRSSVGMQVPVFLWSTLSFVEHDQNRAVIQGIYLGFMLVMLLYNLFLYATVRSRTYLLYVPMVLGQLIWVQFPDFWGKSV